MTSHIDTYTDTPFIPAVDTPSIPPGIVHGDTHVDTPNVEHGDNHADMSSDADRGDSHGDSHTDTPQIAAVSIHMDHQDRAAPQIHTDVSHFDQHGDIDHIDTHEDFSPPIMHGELPPLPPEHIDMHGDTPEVGHADAHGDVPYLHIHGDGFSFSDNGMFTDIHFDSPEPRNSFHTDIPGVKQHTDISHVAHGDLHNDSRFVHNDT